MGPMVGSRKSPSWKILPRLSLYWTSTDIMSLRWKIYWFCLWRNIFFRCMEYEVVPLASMFADLKWICNFSNDNDNSPRLNRFQLLFLQTVLLCRLLQATYVLHLLEPWSALTIQTYAAAAAVLRTSLSLVLQTHSLGLEYGIQHFALQMDVAVRVSSPENEDYHQMNL